MKKKRKVRDPLFFIEIKFCFKIYGHSNSSFNQLVLEVAEAKTKGGIPEACHEFKYSQKLMAVQWAPFSLIFRAFPYICNMDGKNRKDINIGQEVEIVKKEHQRTGELTQGQIKRILTKVSFHPHGIKVQLESGEVGRVKNILEEPS
ncbi:hypothetical protein P872_21355 [Rhodonellum psychrophilum GCM71 = DSM 17998]|uniref:YwbE family protein n=3 Tax=Cytophagaceae TaxID=89373 RepID=U5BT70_9BACT|nr:hypothetical protein P872_21355 [Rhodonellum psychrophilum GCM71 = DSM 17998]